MGSQRMAVYGLSLAFSERLAEALSWGYNVCQVLKRVKSFLVKDLDGRLKGEERRRELCRDLRVHEAPASASKLVRWLYESLVAQETPGKVSCHFGSVSHQYEGVM